MNPLFRLSWAAAMIAAVGLAPIAFAQVTGADVDESQVEVILYVAQQHADATDAENDGQNADRPLATIGAAFRLAEQHLRAERGTKILIAPGTYRESEDATRLICRDWTEAQREAVLVIEGAQRGKAIISGSDDWSGGWEQVEGYPGLYKKPWPHRWGLAPNPWYERFGVVIEALGNRRETVYIDGQRLTPVLLERFDWHILDDAAKSNDPDGRMKNPPAAWRYLGDAELDVIKPGMFGVTEREDNDPHLYVRAPEGVDLNEAMVEVGMRGSLMRIVGRRNLVLRNLTFTHSNKAVGGGPLPLAFFNDNMLIEACDIVENNSHGLSVGKGQKDITIRNSSFNHNGWSGVGGSIPDNLLLVDNESSYNNWRGHLGDQHGCDAAGAKFMGPLGPTGVHVIRHRSIGNLAHGLWFDHVESDVARLTIEDSYFVGNRYGSQLYLEKQAGPVHVKRCVMWEDGEADHVVKMVGYNITIEDCIIYAGQAPGETFHLGGRNNSPYRWMQDWTLRNNIIALGQPRSIFFHSYGSLHPDKHNQHTLKTLTASGNLYASPDGPGHPAFLGIDKHRVPFAEWQALTGADTDAVFLTDSPFVDAAAHDWRLTEAAVAAWPGDPTRLPEPLPAE